MRVYRQAVWMGVWFVVGALMWVGIIWVWVTMIRLLL